MTDCNEALIRTQATQEIEYLRRWYAKASIDEEGWMVEIAIPYQSINFDPEGTAWGFNVRRLIRRHEEEARWAELDGGDPSAPEARESQR